VTLLVDNSPWLWYAKLRSFDFGASKFRKGKEFPMRDKVEAALGEIRPLLQADGGDVELVDVTDGVVKIKLVGACNGCPMAAMTLGSGIRRVLKEQVPEVKEVIAVSPD
jgi:Fe-S cluster biogenesis protein NfuA